MKRPYVINDTAHLSDSWNQLSEVRTMPSPPLDVWFRCGSKPDVIMNLSLLVREESVGEYIEGLCSVSEEHRHLAALPHFFR